MHKAMLGGHRSAEVTVAEFGDDAFYSALCSLIFATPLLHQIIAQ